MLWIVEVALFATMISVVFAEVVLRYVFLSPTVWTESLARLCMVWLVLNGMALAIRHSEHIRVDVFVTALPRSLQWVFGLARLAATAVIAGVLILAGYQIAIANVTQIAPGIGIPVFWKYFAVPVAGCAMVLFLLEKLFNRDFEPF